jgi:hypothetical protein
MRGAIPFCLLVALTLFPAAAHSIDTGEEHVKFAPKSFFDHQESVGISGTLTGPNLGWKTNTFAITCIKELNHCIVASVQAIGDNHIGRMDNPYLIPIIKWNDYEVVAQEEMPMSGCIRVTFTMSRKQQTALWIEEPVNQTTAMCAKSDGTYRKYTIEDPPWWKEMKSRR